MPVTVSQILDAKQALHRHRSDWHADPTTMTKAMYVRRERELLAEVHRLQALYAAQEVIA